MMGVVEVDFDDVDDVADVDVESRMAEAVESRTLLLKLDCTFSPSTGYPCCTS